MLEADEMLNTILSQLTYQSERVGKLEYALDNITTERDVLRDENRKLAASIISLHDELDKRDNVLTPGPISVGPPPGLRGTCFDIGYVDGLKAEVERLRGENAQLFARIAKEFLNIKDGGNV